MPSTEPEVSRRRLVVFGEVLFDCFEDTQVLGGAPFNVAWHLCALGDAPLFVSRIGDDAMGNRVRQRMAAWGLDDTHLQTDAVHPTGRVDVTLEHGEPCYHICGDCAWDYIAPPDHAPAQPMLFYHGSLALRGASRRAADAWRQAPGAEVYLDANLRAGHWGREEVMGWLEQARWAQMNAAEFQALTGFESDDREAVMKLREQAQLDSLLLTRGAGGVLVCDSEGCSAVAAPAAGRVVDAVGAGDAVSAMVVHGLRQGHSVRSVIPAALNLATAVLGIRGALPTERTFYAPLSPPAADAKGDGC